MPAGLAWALLALAMPIAGCTGRDGAGPARSRPGPRARPAEAPGVLPIVTECSDLPVKTRDGLLAATPAAPGAALDQARAILEEQIGLYPARFLRLIGLKEVVLCSTLTFDGTPCGAFADVERGRLFLQFQGRVSAGPFRRTIHHEVFHQVDYADDHRLDVDARWEALNRPGFRYTRDALRVQADPDAMVPDDSLSGFVTLYATTSVAEDKAETYGLMMVDPALIAARAADDPVIAAKADRIREVLDQLGPTGRSLLKSDGPRR